MKKFLLNVLAIVSVFLVCGNLTAWGQVESNPTSAKSGTAIKGISYTIDGTYIKGYQNYSTGVTGVIISKDKSPTKITVNSGYIITGIYMKGNTNENDKTTTVTSIYVDGDKSNNLLTEPVPLDPRNKGTYTEIINKSGINATKSIEIEHDCVKNYSLQYTITYEKVYTLTTEDTDYYSLYLDYNASIPSGVTAYTGSLSDDEKTLVLSQITDGVIPANQGVLVKSTAAGSYTFNQSDTDPSATSDLKGVTKATAVSDLEEADKTVLTLGKKGDVIGFRKPASESIGANKAYLLVTTTTSSGGAGAPELVIGIDDDETTGINGVKADNADVDAPMFNIAGQRVSNSAKGLVIKNGKKYMLK